MSAFDALSPLKSHRPSGRKANEMRVISLKTGVARHAEGSCLVEFGHTHVLVTASVDQGVPSFLKGKGQGWVTAEYGMLPRSTHTRSKREAASGKQGGRTLEIQRLIGRSLRAVVDLSLLGERQITLDCDVIQADGGTRTASITGAYVALSMAMDHLVRSKLITKSALIDGVSAISCGVYKGVPVVDLDYDEDSDAEVDANFIITHSGKLVEVQATGEKRGFERDELNALLDLAFGASQALAVRQLGALSGE
jgi:ribonuclease PH